MSTGERIRRARKAAGLSQTNLASELGKSRSMIANYETDARTPDDETLAEIAEALGVTPQSLQDRNLDSVQDVL